MASFKDCIISNESRSLLTGIYFSIKHLQKFKEIILNDKRSIEKTRIKNEKYNNPWSLSKLQDELLIHLSTYAEAEKLYKNKILIRHYYQEQAEFLLYRINLAKPVPTFIIFESLLPIKLRQALIDVKKCYDASDFNKIVTNAIKRLYEAIDSEYFYLNGISGKIYWRFLP